MPDWVHAAKASVRLLGHVGSLSDATGILISVELLEALTTGEQSDDQGEILDRVIRLQEADFPTGLEALDRAGRATSDTYRETCLNQAAAAFGRATVLTDDHLEVAVIRYYSSATHLLMGEVPNARADIERASIVLPMMSEYERVADAEARVAELRSEYKRGAGLSAARDGRRTSRTLGRLFRIYLLTCTLPVYYLRFVWKSRVDRTYLATARAKKAKEFFGIEAECVELPPEVRQLAAAIAEIDRGIATLERHHSPRPARDDLM